MFTPATIKAIQDIMRQDIGVDGDATRLSQMVWLIYLKILDDEDKALEIRKEKFVPTLPKKYQWRTWAAPLDGITGDKLIDFVNNDLLPGLRELPENGNRRTDLTRMAFQDVYNFMRKGTLLKQVINKVNEIDFNASKDRHAFNEIYERLLKSLQSAGNFGEMYTPRAVTQFIVEMVDPKVGESVMDPAVGTGGFLVHALEHMRKQVKSVKDEQKIQQSIHGVEKKPLPFMLLITNMMLHGIEEPVTMRRGNTLEKPIRDYTDADKVDCIVTNPPFGGTEEPGIESNFPKEFQTRETADLFLVLIMRLLRKHGRAGVVLPDTFLFGDGMKIALKKQLLEECNLHTVIRLPKSVFAPYTSIATNLLFFKKGEPTKEIWYYEHQYPEGQKAYSMTNPIRIEEFEQEKLWWNDREESNFAWKVSIEEIVERNYNLDVKNPRAPQKTERTILSELEKYWEEEKFAKMIGGEISTLMRDVFSDTRTNPAKTEVQLAVDHIEDLIRIPEGIRHLESNLLALAVSGFLVPQELEDSDVEELYTHIINERSNKIRERSKNLKQTKAITPKELPFEIPATWKWVRIGDLFRVDNGFAFKSGNYVDSGVRVIRITNVQDGLIVDNNPKYISDKGIEEYSSYILNENDLLMSLTGNVGRVGLIKKEMLPAVLNQRVARLFPWSESVKPFLYTYLRSSLFQQDAQKGSRGMAQANMSTEWLKEYPIPLPPLLEQERIVKKIEEVMTLINRLKKVMEI